jgi:hypothetical protein
VRAEGTGADRDASAFEPLRRWRLALLPRQEPRVDDRLGDKRHAVDCPERKEAAAGNGNAVEAMASVWVIAGSAGETNQLPAAEANQLPAAEATPQNPSVTTIYFALGPWGLPSSMFGWIWRPVHYKCVGK